LGIFAALAAVMRATQMLVTALGQSATPRLAKLYASSNRSAFQRLLRKLILIGALIGGVGILIATTLGRQLLTILYTPEYGEYVNIFVLIAVVTGLGNIVAMQGCAMRAMRLFKPTLILMMLSSGLTLAFSYMLVPQYELAGAPYALFIGRLGSGIGGSVIIWYALRKILERSQEDSRSC
jgi:O-antigen/teichoic acid export membrane protein